MHRRSIVKKNLLAAALTMLYAVSASGQSWEEVEQAWTEENPAKAFEILNSLGDSGDAEAQYQVAFMFYNGEGTETNDEKAFHWMEKSAYNNFAPAQLVLAKMYSQGIGAPEDKKMYHWWIREAAIRGNTEAQYLLGLSHSNMFISDEEGIPYSVREGIRWLEKASNNAHVDAMTTLGNLYKNGDLEDNFIDIEKAKLWLSRAAESGSEKARKALDEIN